MLILNADSETLTTLKNAVLALIISLSVSTLLIIFYRCIFHPLAKYPGPWIAKFTDLYQVYHGWRADRHLDFWRLHEKYVGVLLVFDREKSTELLKGEIVRFGPNSLSINTNTGLKSIYGFHANVVKSDFYRIIATNKGYSTHSCIDRELHAHKRRVLSHGFSEKALKSMEKYIVSHIETFCEQPQTNRLEAQWDSPKNLSSLCNFLFFDIMGDLSFGDSFGMLTKPENHFVIDLIENTVRRQQIVGYYPILQDLKLDKLLFSNITSGSQRFAKFVKQQATKRTQLGLSTDRRDFFYYLLNAQDPDTGVGFSMPELWAESSLLIIAGSDTSSTALAASFFYLLHNQDALRRLEEELFATFAGAQEIRPGQELNRCSYLRACIDEALRLSPPIPGLLPREVLKGGILLDGNFIPEGTVIGSAAYSIHHNAKYFPDPFHYIPERWIPGAASWVTEEGVELAQSAFVPFSVGPRNCIGRGLAYTGLLAALARTVYTFELRLQAGSTQGEVPDSSLGAVHRKGEFHLQDIFTSGKDGPMVQFRQRRK